VKEIVDIGVGVGERPVGEDESKGASKGEDKEYR